jgi:hypothetical protein
MLFINMPIFIYNKFYWFWYGSENEEYKKIREWIK